MREESRNARLQHVDIPERASGTEADPRFPRGARRGPADRERQRVLALGDGSGLFIELLDNLPGLLFVLDEHGRYVFWNRNTERLLGYTPEELDGRPGIDLVAEEDRQRVARAITEVLQTGSSRVEYSKLARDGRRIPILAEAVRFDFGGRTYIAGVQVDISARRRMERQLVASREDLRSLTSMLASAEETERRRIAAGLHDSAAQDLALAVLELKRLATTIDDPRAEETVDSVCRLVQKTAEELRSLSLDLSPPELYDVGLLAAMESLASRFETSHAIPCRLEAEALPEELPETHRAVAYRSVQELLANVSRHACARSVIIRTRMETDRLEISVEDDGRGFAAAKAGRRPDLGGGFGLFSVREQLRHLGGELQVDSSPGRGTRAVILMPMPATGEAATAP